MLDFCLFCVLSVLFSDHSAFFILKWYILPCRSFRLSCEHMCLLFYCFQISYHAWKYLLNSKFMTHISHCFLQFFVNLLFCLVCKFLICYGFTFPICCPFPDHWFIVQASSFSISFFSPPIRNTILIKYIYIYLSLFSCILSISVLILGCFIIVA